MSTSRLVTETLLSYLQGLSPVLLSRLYQSPPACLAVMRELPELARLYLMRLMFIEQAVPSSDINMWSTPANSSHQNALTILMKLRILETTQLIIGQEGICMNTSYQRNMRMLLCGGKLTIFDIYVEYLVLFPWIAWLPLPNIYGSPWTIPGHHGDDKHSRDVQFLNTYADEQWENILNFMVGNTNSSKFVRSDVLQVLQHAGLMSESSSTHPAFITTLGFQFLLMNRTFQVWYFVMQYLKTAQARELDLIDCLNLIFQLNFSTLGMDYSVKGLTQTQVQFMQHLCQFGLVYQRKKSSKRYYPTKLSINLTSGDITQTDMPNHSSGFILLETNYRVIAYTDSKLHISTLALFCQMQYKFPNMVVGTITRESIHQALMHGITSEQILSFLCMHAHPDMLKKTPLIPATVSDQIRLWEIERDRLQFQEGVLYSDFLSASDFEKICKYAEDLGVLLWSNSGRRLVVVHPSRHDEIRQFWKRQKHS